MKLISVPLIVVLSYLIGEIYKVIFKKKQDLYKLIPVLVSLMGGVIAIIIYITERSIIDVINNRVITKIRTTEIEAFLLTLAIVSLSSFT